MQGIETLKLIPVWVDPAHRVASARILLKGHRLRAMAVLQAGRIVGLVSHESLAGHADEALVEEAMEPTGTIVESSTPIRHVAEVFVREGLEFAPVARDGIYLGIVTANMLLRELGRSWDPLTGLSWSDRLREWGLETLKQGREITLLFIDLDHFGAYNKRYGHIVGDKVLRLVAQSIQEQTDPSRDLLVRYGGDEFAIGSIRTQAEAQELAQNLKDRMRALYIEEAAEPISFSIGLTGGKRTKERENVHYAATLDNLINMASKECQLQKSLAAAEKTENPASEPPAPEAEASQEQIDLVRVFADESDAAVAQVVLMADGQIASGVSEPFQSALNAVAQATAAALEKALPGTRCTFGEIRLIEGPQGERMVSVTGTASDAQGTSASLSAACLCGDDLFAAVAQCCLDAFTSRRRG